MQRHIIRAVLALPFLVVGAPAQEASKTCDEAQGTCCCTMSNGLQCCGYSSGTCGTGAVSGCPCGGLTLGG